MATDQFSLCWNNFHSNLSSGFHSLYETEDFVDVTLAAEGRYLKAHKMVLSVCSQYFKELFQVNPCKHPIVILKDVSYSSLKDLLQFMYLGEVSVSQEELSSLMKVAELLQIKGLTEDNMDSAPINQNGIKNINIGEPRSIFNTVPPHRQLLKRPKTYKRTKLELPEKIARPDLSSSPCRETGASSPPIPFDTDSTPSLIVDTELNEPVQPKHEPTDLPASDAGEFSEHSLPEMDMATMLDTNLGETSSQSSTGWKSEDYPKIYQNAEPNLQGMYLFTRSRKGMPHLIFDSNLFRPSGKIGNSVGTHKYWECVQNRKTSCRARCLSVDGIIETKNREHNHGPPAEYINQRIRMGAVYYMTL